jgi:hypothetical protein
MKKFFLLLALLLPFALRGSAARRTTRQSE